MLHDSVPYKFTIAIDI